MITAVFCSSLSGDFLPIQLVYQGKTVRCHPKYNFPDDWHITHSPNHWSTEETLKDYLNEILFPYIDGVRASYELEDNYAALAISTTSKAKSLRISYNYSRITTFMLYELHRSATTDGHKRQ